MPTEAPGEYGHRVKKWHRPKWRSDQPMTQEDLERQREVFWDTEPHYGGSREIWDALKAACEAQDPDTTKLIIESAGIIVASEDLTICYDSKGFKYDMPKSCWAPPTNLIRQRRSGSVKGGVSGGGSSAQVELPAMAGLSPAPPSPS